MAYCGRAKTGNRMSSPGNEPPDYVENRALICLLVVVSIGMGWILLPFYGVIMWGSIAAMLFAPWYRWLLPRFKNRATLAALVTLAAVVVIVIFPLVMIAAALAREAALVYQRIESGQLNIVGYFQTVFNLLPAWITDILGGAGLSDFDSLQKKITNVLLKGSQFIATQALSIGQNTFEFFTSIFITLYLAFFLIRDGKQLARSIRHAIPLAPIHKNELIAKFATVIRATVKGNLIVALIQGILGGLAFWVLGVGAAVLWAVLMAFLSLLPAVGAALVWLPVAVYFFITGSIWQGVVLIAWGVLVIGLVDNLLRPLMVGKDTQMPDYVVMITTLGGMTVFGINGFVLGPAIAAMFIAVWHIYSVSTQAQSHDNPTS
jgi:predicted PurR-regulated permease PerM